MASKLVVEVATEEVVAQEIEGNRVCVTDES